MQYRALGAVQSAATRWQRLRLSHVRSFSAWRIPNRASRWRQFYAFWEWNDNGVPYLTKGYDNAMFSHGRFAVVVFPAYIVVGHLLVKLPRWAAWTILGLSTVLMGIYAGPWAAGRPFF